MATTVTTMGELMGASAQVVQDGQGAALEALGITGHIFDLF